MKHITNDIYYAGVNDHEIDLFEGQFDVPNGMAYNSYVIMDEKTAVMDTVDIHFGEEWLQNIQEVLGERKPDYLVVQHMEPDHSANIVKFLEAYPEAEIVGNAKTFQMISNFYDLELEGKKVTVANNGTLSLGVHELTFVFAPMVHWPEVMVTYDSKDKVLFSADGFGKFGALDVDEAWACEARRYYMNIVGKYGAQVQVLLKKAAVLDIQTICPLHGPVLSENSGGKGLSYYFEKFQTWSSYTPEDEGIVIAYASIHGNTKQAALKLASILEEKGVKKVVCFDLARDDMAEAIEDAFRYDKMVLAAATYDAGLFPCMESFLAHLKSKNYQKRTIGLMENGSWAPMAGKLMKEGLSGMKEIAVLEPVVTIKSTLNQQSEEQLKQLADALLS